jgi:hypothetical protein
MKLDHIAAMMLLSWTMIITQPRATPVVQMGFPTKTACEQAAAKWRAKFETDVKEGTNRTTERRRRLARAVPSIKCVESTKAPSAHP